MNKREEEIAQILRALRATGLTALSHGVKGCAELLHDQGMRVVEPWPVIRQEALDAAYPGWGPDRPIQPRRTRLRRAFKIIVRDTLTRVSEGELFVCTQAGRAASLLDPERREIVEGDVISSGDHGTFGGFDHRKARAALIHLLTGDPTTPEGQR